MLYRRAEQEKVWRFNCQFSTLTTSHFNILHCQGHHFSIILFPLCSLRAAVAWGAISRFHPLCVVCIYLSLSTWFFPQLLLLWNSLKFFFFLRSECEHSKNMFMSWLVENFKLSPGSKCTKKEGRVPVSLCKVKK